MTENEPENARLIDDCVEVLRLVELRDIVTYELSARRHDGQGDEGENQTPQVGELVAPEFQLFVQESDTAVAVRARTENAWPGFDAVVDVAAQYSKSEPFRMPAETQAEFIERIALMNVYPYIRQHISDLSQRLGLGITLGLLRIEDGQVRPMGSQDEADERQEVAPSKATDLD